MHPFIDAMAQRIEDEVYDVFRKVAARPGQVTLLAWHRGRPAGDSSAMAAAGFLS
jgi:hypothetical protein